MPKDSVKSGPETNKNSTKNSGKSAKIQYHLGVFFDGTNNNKWNISEYKVYKKWKMFQSKDKDKFYKGNDSYIQGYSNVARFSMVFDEFKSDDKVVSHVYVEGIGTAARSSFDSSILFRKERKSGNAYEDVTNKGKAFGSGETGINAKVARGCRLIYNQLFWFSYFLAEKREIDLHLYVMGFSRGSAAARRFVSCIKKTQGDVDDDYEECLMNRLKSLSLLKINNISVDFLGLYDTVSSYGFWKTLFSYSDNVKELALNLNIVSPKYVYQLCAADEYRDHFSLTRILSASNKKEYIIPGAHSDVGGGYEKEKEEIWGVVKVNNTSTTNNAILNSCFDPEKDILYSGYITKKKLIADKWFNEDDIKAGKRIVYDSYSMIPFLLMKRELENHSSGETLLNNSIVSSTRFNEDGVAKPLADIKTALYDQNKEFYSFQSDNGGYRISKPNEEGDKLLKEIRRNFIHLSAQGGVSNGPAYNNIRVVVDDSKGGFSHSGGGGGGGLR